MNLEGDAHLKHDMLLVAELCRMAPRGEVGLIVASLGLSLGAIPTQIFSVVVIMSILTTLVVPPVLRILYAGHPETAVSAEDEESQAGLLPDL